MIEADEIKTSFERNGDSAINLKTNKLWVLTELYYPENNQTGYYMTRIAEGLAEKFDVKIICGQPNYAARGTRAAKRERHRGADIRRVWGTTLNKDVLVLRLVNMLTLGASMFVKSLFEIKKKDFVLVVSAPPSLPFLAAIAAKIKRARLILVIQDKYPEILVAVGKSKPDSFFIKTLNRFNQWLYKATERIVVVGRDMQQLVERQTDEAGAAEKISVIQNWASLEEIEPLARDANPILRELKIADKFVFLYAGNMGHPQDIETIVECAEKLGTDSRFHFLFIGSGVKRKWLEKEIREKNLANVSVLAPRSRDEQKIFLNACDVGLVPLVKNMYGVAMPSRTYNFLAAGKPILALTENNSEVAQVIEEYKVGWHTPPLDSSRLETLINQIYAEREQLPAMGERARTAAISYCSEAVAVEKYQKLFTDAVILNQRKSIASDNE